MQKIFTFTLYPTTKNSAIVAGQVAAKEGEFGGIHGFPSEVSIARSVQALPASVGGKVIGEGTPIEISSEAGHVVKLSIEHGKWQLLSITDTFSIVDSTGEAFAGGVYIKEFSNIIGKKRTVMYSPDDKPICVAVRGCQCQQKI